MLRYLANCSMLFTELPVLQRPAAARAAGFDAIEFWWPFPDAVPNDREVQLFISTVADAGVQLAGLNFAAGDLRAGDRGLVSWPGRTREFADNVDIAVSIGAQLGTEVFNALYGNRIADFNPAAQDALATRNLALAAKAAATIGATVLVEPVSGAEFYPLRTAADAVQVLDRVRDESGAHNLGLLADLYHLTVNGDDLASVITTYAGRVRHVQIADAPGRGEPGTGQIDLARHLDALAERGYSGWVGLEYKPSTDTENSLRWLLVQDRSVTVPQH
ncbi:MAG TPA: TIM barrel protein [Jatrophihabitans sp.]|jgi:hydroxypyruvate isomerase